MGGAARNGMGGLCGHTPLPSPTYENSGKAGNWMGVGLSYSSGGLTLEGMTFLDDFHPFGILSFYIWGEFFIPLGRKTGKSMLFCIVQSSMCLFMMGSLLGSPFKRNCERNQTGKGGTIISIRSITGNAQTQ